MQLVTTNYLYILEIPNIANDEMYKTNSLRSQNIDKLKLIIEDKLQHKNTDEWIKVMENLKIPCPIFNIKQAVENPQIKERNMIVKSFHKKIGEFKSAGNPIKMSITKMKKQGEIFQILMNTEIKYLKNLVN